MAPTTATLLSGSAPSSSVSSAATTRSPTPESVDCPRRGAKASTSSRKMSDGAESRARWNNSRTAFSEEPTHLSISSAPLTMCTVSLPDAARARTRKVLPQPGGPYSSTPRAGCTPSRVNASGCCSGQRTVSVRAARVSSISPTSSSVMAPSDTSSMPERDMGRITVSAPSISSCSIRDSVAASLSASLSAALTREAARSAASRTSARISAATYPGVRAATPARSSSPTGTFAKNCSSSCWRCPESGNGSSRVRSQMSGSRSRWST